jgi:hypothetical protein
MMVERQVGASALTKNDGAAHGALPNFVIIGAMKSATTTLHGWLNQHPDIAMSEVKEINFFLAGHWEQGIEWYARHFDPAALFRGESSTSYTKFPQRAGVPDRMHAVIPAAKLIYILRDPIERTVSHYFHAVQRGRERRSLSQALSVLEDNTYVDPSRYHFQLEQYLPHYPVTRILVLTTEELRHEPNQALQEILAFLDGPTFTFDTRRVENVAERRGQDTAVGRVLESYRAKRIGRHLPRSAVDLAKRLNVRLSRRVTRPTIDRHTRSRLESYLAGDVARLRALTGKQFERWSL